NAAMLTTPAVPTISSIAPTCSSDGVSTITNYNGALTYVFTPVGPTVGAGGVINGMNIGASYTVTAGNGSCVSSASTPFNNAAMLVSPAVPIIDTITPTCLVSGSNTITNYDGTLTYIFTPSGPTVGAGGVINGMIVGENYSVVADNGNCTSGNSSSFVLETTPTPISIDFTGQCINGSFTLIAEPRNSSYFYEWFDSTGISIGTSDTQVVTSSGVYTLVVDNGDGCISTVTLPMDSVFCNIPKGISPNNDGLNDNWDIAGINAKSVHIFNRYGVTVYEHGS
ncbi:gliding motility-associated C-terminal domain-containing protein, partial [Flavobacterium enshiense]|uniref:T9SS type B sorting domain-containing protein n=1 Tax=Flavobacterium enshiense TaxID=1341165 RepID=UPI00345D2D5B